MVFPKIFCKSRLLLSLGSKYNPLNEPSNKKIRFKVARSYSLNFYLNKALVIKYIKNI